MFEDLQIETALAHHRAGRLAQADALYRRILAIWPEHPDALYLLGFLACQLGHYSTALELTERAIRFQPRLAEAHLARGIALNGLGQLPAAIASYDRALALNPSLADAHLNRGNAHCGLQQHAEAIADFDRVLLIQPGHTGALQNRAIALHALAQYQAALESCDLALALDPSFAEAHLTRANALHALGRHHDAVAGYDHAIQVKPDYADAHFNRGVTLQHLGRQQDARASYDHAIRLAPTHAEAWQNRGIAHLMLLDYHAALADFDRAIELKPLFTEAHNNRASTLLALGRHQDALHSFNTVARLKPTYDWLPGTRLHLKSFLCDWDNFDAETRDLEAAILRGERAAPPFVILALSDSPAVHRRAAEIYLRANYPGPTDPGSPTESGPHTRLRIAYFSADFSAHATCSLMAELFERHDRSRFDIFAFSFGPDTADPVRQRIAAAFPANPDPRFLDVRALPDRDIAQLARSLEIDIAVDLKGFTTEARPGIFAHRAAPIQVSYLGYPGTMGAPYIDALIADRTVIPPSAQHHYSEKVVYLPNTYQPNPSHRPSSPTDIGCPTESGSPTDVGCPTESGCPIFATASSSLRWGPTEPGGPPEASTRAAHSLPDSAFVFCCFNNIYKITPPVFDSWMRILVRVPTGVLWLLEPNSVAAANLRREAARRAVDPARILFAPRLPEPDHLARLALADLFLDTFPYNAHTTASDALYAGVPVLTRIGESFPSRVAASLLHALTLPTKPEPTEPGDPGCPVLAGCPIFATASSSLRWGPTEVPTLDLPDLITTTPAAYEDLAVTLAHSPALYRALRTRLQQNRATAPLFDCPAFTRHLESLYLTLHQTASRAIRGPQGQPQT